MLDFLLEHHLLIFESSWLIALITLVIATPISLEKRDPAKTLCWLLVLFLVPVLGMVLATISAMLVAALLYAVLLIMMGALTKQELQQLPVLKKILNKRKKA